MGRRIVAVVLGLLAGGGTVGIVEYLSSLIHPMPAGVTVNDQESLSDWIENLPVTAHLMLLLAWGAGCFTGSFVARVLTPQRGILPSLIVVAALTFATLFNLITLPHPWWMWPTSMGVCLVGLVLGLLCSSPNECTIIAERRINAPLDKVFSTVADIRNFSTAIDDIINIEFLSDQQFGVGTRFRETRVMNGKEATTELEVTELVDDESIRIISDAGGTIWDTLFQVREEDGLTTLEMTMDCKPYTLFAKLLVPAIIPVVDKAVGKDLDSTKKYCEQNFSEP